MRLSFLLPLLCLTLSWGAHAADVLVITDDNFDSLIGSTDTIWMLDVYAPWCTHCRQLEPMWRAFAEESETSGIMVGKVDGVDQRVLMQRFGVTAYPSIFLLRDGRSWRYEGVRTIAGFKAFALRGFMDVDPMPYHKCPNSVVGRAMGYFYSIPSLMSRVYKLLKEEHHLSDLVIVMGALAVPVVLGAAAICAVDAAYLRKARTRPDHDD